jgi:transketolase
MLGWDVAGYAARARAFGWHAIEIDGHDLDAIDAAYREAVETTGQPIVVLARTLKGKGVEAVENKNGFHGKPLPDPEEAIQELGGERNLRVTPASPDDSGSPHRFHPDGAEPPQWELGEEVATRNAYGDALAALGSRRGDVVALDGEVSNSTLSQTFAEAHPDRYLEMFIAEQQMIAAAVGTQVRGWVPFASTFAAFFTRAYDFIRMAAISRANLRLCGSHAGVSIGEDGPSQMALEDFAVLRAVHSSAVLHPSDANQVPPLLEQMAGRAGISYMRTLRGKTTVRTRPDDDIRIGGSRIVRSSDQDDFTVVACGVTVEEAEQAADQLEADGMRVRVIDCYSIKPIDSDTLATAARETKAIVTVEDHWPEGGLGEAVMSALAQQVQRPPIVRLAVCDMPMSGTPAELLHAAGIDAEAIVEAVRGVS